MLSCVVWCLKCYTKTFKKASFTVTYFVSFQTIIKSTIEKSPIFHFMVNVNQINYLNGAFNNILLFLRENYRITAPKFHKENEGLRGNFHRQSFTNSRAVIHLELHSESKRRNSRISSPCLDVLLSGYQKASPRKAPRECPLVQTHCSTKQASPWDRHHAGCSLPVCSGCAADHPLNSLSIHMSCPSLYKRLLP